jgi:hypothetical protein
MRSAEANLLASKKTPRKFRAVCRGTVALLVLLSCNSFAQAAFQFDPSPNFYFMLYNRLVSRDGNTSQSNSRESNQFSGNDGANYDLHTFCAGVQLLNVNCNAVTIGCRDHHGNVDPTAPAIDVDLPNSESNSTDADDEPANGLPAVSNLPGDLNSIVDSSPDLPNSDSPISAPSDPATDNVETAGVDPNAALQNTDPTNSDPASTDPTASDPPISLSPFTAESDTPTVNADNYVGPDDDWDPVAAAPEVSSLAVWSVLGLCGIAVGLSRRRKVGCAG